MFSSLKFGDRANEIMSGCGRLGSCSSGGVGSTGGEWNSVPVRRTKHLWWVRPKWLYAKAAVRVTHARDLVPRGSQRSRTAPGFTTFPQRLAFREVVHPTTHWTSESCLRKSTACSAHAVVGSTGFPFQEVVAELKRSKKLLRTSPSGDSKGRAYEQVVSSEDVRRQWIARSAEASLGQ